MGVLDGQPVSAVVTNPAFINKNQNDAMPNILSLTRSGSGTTIADIQQAVNYLYTATGVTDSGGNTVGTAYNATPGTITNGQTYVSCLRTLADKFDSATGHLHSGSPGDGPILPVVHTIAASSVTGAAITGALTLSAGSTLGILQTGQTISYFLQPSLNGSAGSPTTVSPTGGVILTALSHLNFAWVQGASGGSVVTAVPSITSPIVAGQQLFVIGMSNSNPLTLQDNSVLSGSKLRLNGNAVLTQYSVLSLISDSNLDWVENVRR